MILTLENIVKVLKEIKADAPRRKAAHDNFMIYEGELSKEVKKRIIKKYPQTHEDYTIADYNIHKKITDKKAKAYKVAPLRKLVTQSETDRLNSLLEDFEFDSAMKLVDRYHNQYQHCALGIIRKRVEGRSIYSFWALQPFEFCVIRDSDGEIVCWAIPNGRDDNGEYWTLWTDESHMKIYTKDFQSYSIVANPGNEKNINPFKIMPFVYVPMDISGRYPLPSTIPEKAIEVNTNLSIYLTSGNMQIGQLVIKHPTKQQMGEVVTGLRVAMKLPQMGGEQADTTAEYISPSPDLEGHKNSILLYMMLILDEGGITNTKIGDAEGQSFTSGFDRLIANADVQDIIEDNQSIYAKVENKAYRIIRAIHLADGDISFSSPKLMITYQLPTIMLNDSEKLENLRKKKELGLWEEWELLREANPNLSEEEAKTIIAERKSKTLDTNTVFNGAQVTSLVEVVAKVALKEIPRESGIQILIASFGISEEMANRIVPQDSFKPNTEDNNGNNQNRSFGFPQA